MKEKFTVTKHTKTTVFYLCGKPSCKQHHTSESYALACSLRGVKQFDQDNILKLREKRVRNWNIVINFINGSTLEECGKPYDISSARVMQIRDKCLRMMRHSSRRDPIIEKFGPHPGEYFTQNMRDHKQYYVKAIEWLIENE